MTTTDSVAQALTETIPIPLAAVFALGTMEVVDALAPIVPMLIQAPTGLAPSAAWVLAGTAALAVVVHAARGGWSLVPVNLVPPPAPATTYGSFIRTVFPDAAAAAVDPGCVVVECGETMGA